MSEVTEKKVVVVTGASSGFGALAVRSLARAGHTVYAGMRETLGRNAPAVAELGAFGAEHSVDVHVDPSQDGAEVLNAVADRVRGEFLRRVELADLI